MPRNAVSPGRPRCPFALGPRAPVQSTPGTSRALPVRCRGHVAPSPWSLDRQGRPGDFTVEAYSPRVPTTDSPDTSTLQDGRLDELTSVEGAGAGEVLNPNANVDPRARRWMRCGHHPPRVATPIVRGCPARRVCRTGWRP